MTVDKMMGMYCRFCWRLREILYEAPWSSFDLITASITFWLGLDLLLSPGLFQRFAGVYQVLSRLGNERLWGCWFIVFGAFGLLNVLWLTRPPFPVRLLARMGIAFCLLSLALNNLGNVPPPASSVTYSVLSCAALWCVWRTKTSGR